MTALADRLDELEAKELPLTSPLQNYRLFKHLIESYRDQLDELED